MPGWYKLWATFRTFLEHRPRRVDVTVPSRLGDILASSGFFEDIVVKQANVPVGFWPQGESTMKPYGIISTFSPRRLIVGSDCRVTIMHSVLHNGIGLPSLRLSCFIVQFILRLHSCDQ
jgi:hypothetical protein